MTGAEASQLPEEGWTRVTLGIGVPTSHLCLCCLTFNGPGLSRSGLSYCVACWETRRAGRLCSHAPNGGLPPSPHVSLPTGR